MKTSLRWLRRLVDLPEDSGEVAAILTRLGFEVEGITAWGHLPGVVVGEIRACEPVEGTRLSRCTVFDGAHEISVVCGAPEVRSGMRVPLATVGCILPDGKRIEASEVRGMPSFGMLCGADELGLSENPCGLMSLPPGMKAGLPLSQVLDLPDHVLEVNVTPNRPDATGHLGLARELSVATGRPLREPWSLSWTPNGDSTKLTVELDPDAGCTRFVGRTLRGLCNGPSPDWMTRLLRAVGLRSISAIVDVTNFVLLETGQPLHAYDLDRLQGKHLRVRRMQGEGRLQTLDGVERGLDPRDLVVSDAAGPLCLAGVMGGLLSGTGPKTHAIFLETAWFDPRVVRSQSRRHRLTTDSSYRFERGVDPLATPRVADYAARLILECCGGVADHLVDVRLSLHPDGPREVDLRSHRLDRLLGTAIDSSRRDAILRSLGCQQVSACEPSTRWAVPGWRPDLAEEVDLVEEVARVVGYDSIPSLAPRFPVAVARLPPDESWIRALRRFLVARGFHETISLRFASAREHGRLGLPAQDPRSQLIALANPLSEELGALPRLTLGGLLRSAVHNQHRQERSLSLFECGRVFGKDLPDRFEPHRRTGVGESRTLAMLLAGPISDAGWTPSEPVGFWHLRGHIEAALWAGGIKPVFQAGSESHVFLHPGRAARIFVDGHEVGWIGALHPLVAEAWDFRQEIFVTEIDLEPLLAGIAHQPLPRPEAPPMFPGTSREVNLLVPDEIPAAALLDNVLNLPSASHPWIRGFEIVSMWRGEGLPPKTRTLLVRLEFRNPSRTLVDDEVNTLVIRLRDEMSALPGIALR